MDASEVEYEKHVAEKQKRATAVNEGIEIINNRAVPTPIEQAKMASAKPLINAKEIAKLMRAVHLG